MNTDEINEILMEEREANEGKGQTKDEKRYYDGVVAGLNFAMNKIDDIAEELYSKNEELARIIGKSSYYEVILEENYPIDFNKVNVLVDELGLEVVDKSVDVEMTDVVSVFAHVRVSNYHGLEYVFSTKNVYSSTVGLERYMDESFSDILKQIKYNIELGFIKTEE